MTCNSTTAATRTAHLNATCKRAPAKSLARAQLIRQYTQRGIMPPRLNIWGACRPIALRSRPQASLQQPSIAALARRHYSGDTTSSEPPSGPGSPSARGSSIPSIPDSMLRPGEQQPPQIREEDVQMREATEQETALQQLQMAAHGLDSFKFTGYKFEEPPMPEGKTHLSQYHMRHRYEEGISQLTRLLMRDGKLSKAQNVSSISCSRNRHAGTLQLIIEAHIANIEGHRTWPWFSPSSVPHPHPKSTPKGPFSPAPHQQSTSLSTRTSTSCWLSILLRL